MADSKATPERAAPPGDSAPADGETAKLSTNEVEHLRGLGLSGGVVAGLAAKAIELQARRLFPGAEPRPVSSTVSTLGDIAPGPLCARATLVSGGEADRHVWRARVHQDGGGRQVAEVTAVYEIHRHEPARARHHAAAAPEAASGEPTPPPPSSLNDKSKERRRQIFEGACAVIARRGFGNASIREIAQEAGLSVPLMYKHIKDKDDILYLITSECMNDILNYFEEHRTAPGTPEKNMCNAIDRYVDYIGKNRKYINLVYSETRALSPENRQKIFSMEKRFLRYWKNIIDDGIVKGAFKPVDSELAANFVYFLCTVWSLRYWSIGHFEAAEIKQALADFILSGIRRPT